MINAIELVDNYMNTKVPEGRRNSPVAVTVLQYREGVLYYSTNTDMIKGYNVVNEETITAHVEPGAYIFWVTGSGVDYLDEIEFDVVAEYTLRGRNAEAGEEFKMWLVRIPEDIEANEDGELKYDIVYGCKDNDGNPIRLDPKLKIQ